MTIADVPMPSGIAKLPRDRQGRPIPWFVATLPDGSRDFRIVEPRRHGEAHTLKLCWICGQPRGANLAFTIGPMCAVNRISAEPPAHRDCAVFSAKVCPFLSRPSMRRREGGLPGDAEDPAGVMLRRNPGVVLVWMTRSYTPFRPPGGGGVLYEIGAPTATLWFAVGRAATRAEVIAAMESGLPALDEACDLDANPSASRRALKAEYGRALALVPAGAS